MKEIICTEPGVMKEVKQVLSKDVKADEILVAVKRIGVCGTDIHAYGGNQPFFSYPRTLGHELSGLVETVGSNVTHARKGDIVTILPYMNCGICTACESGKTNCCTNMKVFGVHIDGGMASYIKVPEDHVFVVNNLTLDEAAIIEPLSIGAHAVRRAEIKKDDSVLIIGAGPIGLGVARFAKLQGATTTIMDISEERLQFCKDWAECDFAIQPNENTVEMLLDINNGNLPSIVMDATGNKHSMTQAFNYAGNGGKLVYVGLVKDTITFSDPDFHAKELTLLGSRNATKEDFEYVIKSLSNRSVKSSYVTNQISFDDLISYFEKGDFGTNKTMAVIEG